MFFTLTKSLRHQVDVVFFVAFQDIFFVNCEDEESDSVSDSFFMLGLLSRIVRINADFWVFFAGNHCSAGGMFIA